jgi:MATE family multidrug resistance protein
MKLPLQDMPCHWDDIKTRFYQKRGKQPLAKQGFLENYSLDLRQTLHLAAPIVLGQVGHMLMNMIDAIMVGSLGAAPLGASAFVGGVFAIPLIFMLGVASSISTRVAQSFGAERFNECGHYLWTGLIMVLAMSLAITLGMEALRPNLVIFNQTPEVLNEAKPYFRVICWSLIPLMFFNAHRQFSDGLSMTYSPMVIMGIGILTNIFLNWVLIFGKLGAPALGLYGAGVGTFVARCLMALLIFFYVRFQPKYKNYLRTVGSAVRKEFLNRLLKIGVPSGFQYVFEVGAFASASIMMGWIGTKSIAAHQIAINLAGITFMFALGISFALNVRVGQEVGRDDIAKARRVGFNAISFTAMMMLLFAVTMIVLRFQLPRIYIADVEVIAIAAKLLIVAAFFQVFDGVQAVSIGALRGASDVKVPTAITFVAYWLFSIPCMYFLGIRAEAGPMGIWFGLALGLALSATALAIRFYLVTKK